MEELCRGTPLEEERERERLLGETSTEAPTSLLTASVHIVAPIYPINVGFGLQMRVVLELNQPERNNKKGVVLELNPS